MIIKKGLVSEKYVYFDGVVVFWFNSTKYYQT